MISRRSLLKTAPLGLGTAGLQALAMQTPGLGGLATSTLLADDQRNQPKIFGSAAKAKRVIFLFMEGGVSQVDSYDYKPLLEKHHGEDPRKAIGKLEKTQFANIGKVMKSPWKFKQWGESGRWASELFPHINRQLDDLCVVNSMTSKFPEHTSANYLIHSGHGLQGRPSMGAWATYGLGSTNENLPGYVVLNGGQIPSGGLDNFSSGFLPASYQGSLLHAVGTPLANILPIEKDGKIAEIKRKLAEKLNRKSLERSGPVDSLASAIRNAELAAKMQLAVPELTDFSNENAETGSLYGLDAKNNHTRTYAKACLIARRLVERGVRFIEVLIPMVNGYQRWDAHGKLKQNHGSNALAVDQPIAGLLQDLKRRGLLEETLVIWSGEFGRTPFAQGGGGRDHNEHGFSFWMAGGGIRSGVQYGKTDPWGYKSVENKMDVHDLHATLLHLMGVDHKKLTYRFGGRDIRLTDVYGRVVRELLA
ncbi:MAG: DUF1501 domain-containing protein [Planctomycetota bacterium]|nr:DUF1501 domain-containing protein [Planctomycetota bacterium]